VTPLSHLPAAAAAADPLAGLRDYHLPATLSWWPPAPGWWLLGLLLISGLGVLAWWLARRRRCHAAARQAVQELQVLRERMAEQGDAGEFVRRLSILLRRFAMVSFSQRRVAALTGEAWLRFLDEHGGDGRFNQGVGRQLAELPYRPHITPASTQEMALLVEHWIMHNREASL
jgi:hypothetical protein